MSAPMSERPTVIEYEDTLTIASGRVSAKLWMNNPFDMDVDLSLPMQHLSCIGGRGDCITVLTVADPEQVQRIWDVLTVCLFSLSPDYIVHRLPELEGDEVMRQEKS